MQVQNNPVRHRPNTGTPRAGRQAHLLTGEFLPPTAAAKHQQGRNKRIYPVRKSYKALLNNSGLKEKSQKYLEMKCQESSAEEPAAQPKDLGSIPGSHIRNITSLSVALRPPHMC